MGDQLVNPDVRVAGMAARQHGVVSAQQLRRAGIDKSAAFHRVRHGRLHRVHRGVYAVGHAFLTPEGRWMAAVLASGSGAVLSHRSAAALWGLLPVPSGPVDVTAPASSGRSRRAGIRLHRSLSVPGACTTTHRGIPVTTPARTIADLGRAAPAEVRRALRQAAVVGLHIPEGVEADHTRSELESQFLGLCRRHRLPLPEVNVRIGSMTVDFLWRPPAAGRRDRWLSLPPGAPGIRG